MYLFETFFLLFMYFCQLFPPLFTKFPLCLLGVTGPQFENPLSIHFDWSINSETDLSSRCTEGAIGGHRDGVQESRVTDVIGLQLAVGQIPHLKQTKHYQWKVTHVEPLKGHGNKYEMWGKKMRDAPKICRKKFLAEREKKQKIYAENMPLLQPYFSVKLLKNNVHCEKLYINELT